MIGYVLYHNSTIHMFMFSDVSRSIHRSAQSSHDLNNLFTEEVLNTRWRVGWRNTVRSKFGFMILSTSLLVARLLFVVTGRGKLENHTIFTKIITYKSISKNT